MLQKKKSANDGSSCGGGEVFLNSLPFLSHPRASSFDAASTVTQCITVINNKNNTNGSFASSHRRLDQAADSPELHSRHADDSEPDDSQADDADTTSKWRASSTATSLSRNLSDARRSLRRHCEAATVVPALQNEDDEVMRMLRWVVEKICAQNSALL